MEGGFAMIIPFFLAQRSDLVPQNLSDGMIAGFWQIQTGFTHISDYAMEARWTPQRTVGAKYLTDFFETDLLRIENGWAFKGYRLGK